jgi:hypothetical protein
MSEIVEEVVQPEPIDFVEIPFPNVYTNQINVQFSNIDVALVAIERIDKTSATIKARIVMTHAHAKLLRDRLSQQIETHEAKWGEIVPLLESASRADSSSTEPEPQP